VIRAMLSGLAAATVLVALAGCSSETAVAPAPVNNTKTLAVVTPQEIARTPPGSPQRTVLTWWRLTQNLVVRDAVRLFTPAARRELARARYPLYAVQWLGPWLQSGRARVTGVEFPRRGHAIVSLKTTFYEPVANDLVKHIDGVAALALDHRREGWLISDPSWILRTAYNIRAAQSATTRRTPRGNR
jgi:hypothetical protein